jgi:hypothetical protein
MMAEACVSEGRSRLSHESEVAIERCSYFIEGIIFITADWHDWGMRAVIWDSHWSTFTLDSS